MQKMNEFGFNACPFYSGSLIKNPSIRCHHHHSGMVPLTFDSKEEQRSHKEIYCYGDYKCCIHFGQNVGRDTVLERTWIVYIRYAGRDYWKKVVDWNGPSQDDLSQLFRKVMQFSMDIETKTSFKAIIEVQVIHSSDKEFKTILEELAFSGTEIK